MSLLSGRNHLDAPLDYHELWRMLRIRVAELCANQATEAMNSETVDEVRQKQGAYRFGYTLIAEMDRLVDEARKADGPLRRLRDDDAA